MTPLLFAGKLTWKQQPRSAIGWPHDWKMLWVEFHGIREYPDGPIFRNRKGNPWTRFAVTYSFDRLQMVLGQHELAARGIQSTVTDEAVKQTAEQLPKFRVNKRTGKQTEKKP